jgi:hypothetical protein
VREGVAFPCDLNPILLVFKRSLRVPGVEKFTLRVLNPFYLAAHWRPLKMRLEDRQENAHNPDRLREGSVSPFHDLHNFAVGRRPDPLITRRDLALGIPEKISAKGRR